MSKMKIKNNVFGFPMPVTILGTEVKGKANFMALGWVARVNANPPMIGIGVGKSHLTADWIKESQAFSINVPGEELLVETDYVGLVSGKKVDKSKVFDVFTGELKGAPMISQCPVTMECRLVKTLEFQSNILFVGEIVNAYSEEIYLTKESPDVVKINPFLLSMPDNRFWKLGEGIGSAWSIGGNYKG